MSCQACGEPVYELARQDDGEWFCPDCVIQERADAKSQTEDEARACAICGEYDQEMAQDVCGKHVCACCHGEGLDAVDGGDW